VGSERVKEKINLKGGGIYMVLDFSIKEQQFKKK